MKTDLDTLSLKDLKGLQAQVSEKIATYEDRRKKDAIEALEEKARSLGFSLGELLGTSAPRKRKPGKPKYANPDNSADTWTGRGRKPHWVEAALRAGKSIDDLLI